MVIQLRDAYHHWVATKYQVDTMIASAIEEADQGTPRKEEPLVNVCSPCCSVSNGSRLPGFRPDWNWNRDPGPG